MRRPKLGGSMRGRLAALAPLDRLRIYAYLLALVPLVALGVGVVDRLHSTRVGVPGSESYKATQLAKEEFGESESVMVLLQGPRDRLKAEASRVRRELAALPHHSVLDPWSTGNKALLPKPGQAILLVAIREPFESVSEQMPALRQRLRRTVDKPFEVHMTGFADVSQAIQDETVIAVEHAELIAALPLLIVLLLVLGAPIAAALTLFLGGSIALGGWGMLDVLNRFTDLDVSAFSLGTAMSLALGVDYSLLMVTRFQAELARGATVDEASRLASARAGQTIRFAALALAMTMVASLLLIPAGVLKSAVVGVLVAVFLALVGATVVLPPLLRLVGADINAYRLLKPSTRSNRWRTFGEKVLRRPVLSVLVALALLAPLCLPALSFPTGPPDPSELPDHADARSDFEAIKTAVGGTYAAPYVITVAAKKGTLADERFQDLARFERRLQDDDQTLTAIGPARVAAATAALARVPKRLRRVRDRVSEGRSGLERLSDGLGEASSGAGTLIAGLDALAEGSKKLSAGGAQAADGTARVRGGLATASAGAGKLRAGLARAARGGRTLRDGTREADAGAGRLARGLRTAERRTKAAVPGARELASGLDDGVRRLGQLREPADLATQQAEEALRALRRMLPTSKVDPAYAEAYRATATALAALSGRNPETGERVREGYDGLPASLDEAVAQTGRAADGAAELRRGVVELADALGQLSDGGAELDRGLSRLGDGSATLAGGQQALLSGATQLSSGLRELTSGAGELEAGVGQLASGSGQLSTGLDEASTRAAPLGDGLRRLAGGAARVNRETAELAKALTGSTRLAPLFASGYTTVAALETAPKARREAARWAINFDRGGNAVQFLVVPRDSGDEDNALPTRAENPYRGHLQRLTRDLEGDLDAVAYVGGPAAMLAEFDLALSSRLPLMVIALLLITYVGLALMLRNWVLPAVAVSLNVITVGAAFGVMSLLFGGQAPVLGGPGYVDDIMAACIFTVTFALSIDYQIFLLDRMREGYAETGTVQGAIVYGLEHTAGVITGAAAIIVAVFLAFIISPMPNLRQLGVGLSVAVALDATLIRLVLLPAALKLVGPRAWTTGRWSERLASAGAARGRTG